MRDRVVVVVVVAYPSECVRLSVACETCVLKFAEYSVASTTAVVDCSSDA
jgi:hypothetical protein